MSRKQANERVLSLMKDLSGKREALQKVEFFFYADKQDDATNLAIALAQLGYEVYPPNKSASSNIRWCINGWTTETNMNETAINKWTDLMEQLAGEHNSEFDGWGTFVEE